MTQAVKTEDVTWVLTVPVCCSEPAKYFMRKAAIEAGFIQGGHDDEVGTGASHTLFDRAICGERTDLDLWQLGQTRSLHCSEGGC